MTEKHPSSKDDDDRDDSEQGESHNIHDEPDSLKIHIRFPHHLPVPAKKLTGEPNTDELSVWLHEQWFTVAKKRIGIAVSNFAIHHEPNKKTEHTGVIEMKGISSEIQKRLQDFFTFTGIKNLGFIAICDSPTSDELPKAKSDDCDILQP